MKRILSAIVLVAIATAALSNLRHTPSAKASSNDTVYLPLAMGGSDAQTSTPTPEPTPEPTPTTVDPAQLKADVIAAVNAERQNAGCAPGVEKASLSTAAQAWSDYMVANNVFGHSFALDANWYVEHGYMRTDWLSENVNVGPHSGADAVALWMSDEGHKAAILAGCANRSNTFDVGVGFNNYRWTLAIGELHD
jgi:uncharacterized protein YkwD